MKASARHVPFPFGGASPSRLHRGPLLRDNSAGQRGRSRRKTLPHTICEAFFKRSRDGRCSSTSVRSCADTRYAKLAGGKTEARKERARQLRITNYFTFPVHDRFHESCHRTVHVSLFRILREEDGGGDVVAAPNEFEEEKNLFAVKSVTSFIRGPFSLVRWLILAAICFTSYTEKREPPRGLRLKCESQRITY